MADNPKFKDLDPIIYLTAVRCANCQTLLGYGNSKQPTRTVKLVCSQGCGSDHFGSNMVAIKEP